MSATTSGLELCGGVLAAARNVSVHFEDECGQNFLTPG
jgi:hypothetical protein